MAFFPRAGCFEAPTFFFPWDCVDRGRVVAAVVASKRAQTMNGSSPQGCLCFARERIPRIRKGEEKRHPRLIRGGGGRGAGRRQKVLERIAVARVRPQLFKRNSLGPPLYSQFYGNTRNEKKRHYASARYELARCERAHALANHS